MNNRLTLIIGIAVIMIGCGSSPSSKEIESNFSVSVPQLAYPWVWWHWMDGNITKDGIRKDLLWMKGAGVAGFHQFDVGGRNTPQIVPDRVAYLSDQWKDAFSYAIRLADSLGIEAGVASCPGWSCTGGPWISREMAMKKLVWKTMEINGGGECTLTLPEPMTTVGKYLDAPYPDAADIEPWYRDIAAVAVRIPDEDIDMRSLSPELSFSDGAFTLDGLTDGSLATFSTVNPSLSEGGSWIRYDFPSPVTFRAVTIADEMMRSRYIRYPAEVHLVLECSSDGRSFTEVAGIPDNVIYGMTVDFTPHTASSWRLRILPGDGRYAASHDIREFVLHTVTKVNHFQEKAGFAAQDDFMKYPTPETAAPVEDVVCLGKPSEEGTVSCSLPEGRWRVYRFGQALTGKKNHPISPDAIGLEVDKLDPEAWLYHFRTYLGIYRDASGGMMGEKGIKWLLNDSYEAEQMTWTAKMYEQFVARKGYDLYRWLPALAGEVIDSSSATERFLWDWRDVIGSLFAENYDRLGEVVAEFGLKGRFTESHEDGRLFVGDGMDVKMKADIPMSAIWMDNAPNGHDKVSIGEADIRESASVAHITGKKIVAGECFTVSGAGKRGYTYFPGNLKNTADIALGSGLTRFVIHESAHQPMDDKVPGTGLFQYGQWFNRHETWASMARPWMDYLARSCYLLQQGDYVADILWYYGEDNCIVGLYGRQGPDIPSGYSFDYINPRALVESVRMKGGRLVTPSGMSYNVLVLGENCRRMSLPVLRKLVSLAEGGATIVGTVPEEPAGLNDATEEFTSLKQRLEARISYGNADEALRGKGIAPDFTCDSPDVRFLHRRTKDLDIYWVRNFGADSVGAAVSLRTPGVKSLEIWNPESGKRVQAPGCSFVPDGVSLTLPLKQGDAVFLVAKKKASDAPLPGLSPTGSIAVTGPWTVEFQEGRGAPAQVVVDSLSDWTANQDPGIRYFSGVATYTASFRLEEVPSVAEIDLGKVGCMAEVSMNGIPCGTAWRNPYRLDIPDGALRKGENTLQVRVANLWVNRIIGDAAEGDGEKYTTTPVVFYRAGDKLLPSGLMGPVKVII